MNTYSQKKRGKKVDQENEADMADKMQAVPTQHPAGAESAQTIPSPGAKVKWSQQVKDAKRQWTKLSQAEILKSEGNQQQLSNLVQLRYRIDSNVADKQVSAFLAKCHLA